MTKEELAALLNGREYRSEISEAEERSAKDAGLVVVFGASDDLLEFRGAIDDELGAYEGTCVAVNAGGIVKPFSELREDDDATEEDFEAYFKAKASSTYNIVAHWDRDGLSWVIESTIPHATFTIMEDGEGYCRGIVFSINQLTTSGPAEQNHEGPDHGEHLATA